MEKLGRADHAELPYPHIELFFWRPEDGKNINFGDFLSRVVVAKMLALHDRSLDDETSVSRRLLAIGSILHLARDGDLIWGSGINGRSGQEWPRAKALEVRAVRGPLTREVLRKRGIIVPEIFGDPGLLVPRLFPGRFQPNFSRHYVFVPNLHDTAIVPRTPQIISPLMSWNKCIDAILDAKLVLASSLHGMIIAEAYGIPTRYVRLSESESLFKYRDYYLGSGRSALEFATSIEQGLEMGGAEPPKFDAQPLMDAFPIDAWS